MMESPLFQKPIMDPAYHHRWAESIVEGAPITDGEAYFRAPLYPYFLAGIYAMGGNPFVTSRVAQAIIGLLSLYLVYRLGMTVFSLKTGFLALLLGILFPLFVYFEWELLITPLIVFLDLVLLLSLLKADERGSSPLWVISGLLLGLSAIARPNILLFAPAIPLWLLVGRKGGLLRSVVKPVILVAMGSLLVIAPVTVRNMKEGGDFVPIASQGGINFYLGNHLGADGCSAFAQGIRGDWQGGIDDSFLIARRDAGRDLKPSEVSDYWFKRGFRFIRENRGEAARLFARKIYLLLQGRELSNNQSIPFAARYSRVYSLLPVRYGFLLPLALIGILWSGSDRKRLLLVLFLTTYSFSIVFFFVCSRYIMPIVPVLLVFAAAALHSMVEDVRRKRPRWIGKTVLLLLLFFLLNHDFGLIGEEPLAHAFHGEGLILMGRGDLELAEKRMLSAVEEDPEFMEGFADLGIVRRKRGDLQGAEAALRHALVLEPRSAEAHNNLGLTLSMAGKMDEAIESYRNGLSVDPGHAGLRVNLGVLLQRKGQYTEAIEEYRQFLRSIPNDGRVRANLGFCLIRSGSAEEGEAEMRRGVNLTPGYPGPVLLLAAYLHEVRREEEALETLREALVRMPDNPDIEKALADRKPDSGE